MTVSELDLVVLKHILTSKKNALEFVYECNEKIFSPDAWRFSKLVLDHVKLYKEVPTQKILQEKANNDTLSKYIGSLFEQVEKASIDEKEYKHDLEKIKTRFTEKLLYDLKDKIVDDQGRVSDVAKSVNELHSTLNSIKTVNKVKAYEQRSLKENLDDFRKRYKAKQQNPNYGNGLKTGIDFLDVATNGLLPSEMLLILGGTGGGKSIMLNNIAVNMWLGENNLDMMANFKEGTDVVYFSLEMPFEDCFQRVLARIAMVPQVSIRDATLSKEQREDVAKALKFIERYPYDLTIVDLPRNATPEALELIYDDIAQKKGRKPKVVIIDYLALMEYDEPGIDDWLKQGKLAEAVSEFGRVNNINVITAAQLNAENKAKGGGSDIGTHRISRSKLIGHNANFILMIESRQNETQRPDLLVHIIKSRRTQLASGTLFKQLECCALLNSNPNPILEEDMPDNPHDLSEMIE